MAILQILQYPDKRLQKKGEFVQDVKSPQIQTIIDDMLETLQHTKNCAGLAATQLDIDNPPQITVIAESADNPRLCLINPVIVHKEGENAETEACMSVYSTHVYAKVKRATKLTCKALDREGKELTINATGFLAACIQHEVDHLQGILYIDRISKLKRNRIEKKITKLSKRHIT